MLGENLEPLAGPNTSSLILDLLPVVLAYQITPRQTM